MVTDLQFSPVLSSCSEAVCFHAIMSEVNLCKMGQQHRLLICLPINCNTNSKNRNRVILFV